MRDDQRFEIQTAFDLLPHVVGCSWATIWFRLNKTKKPYLSVFVQALCYVFSAIYFCNFSGVHWNNERSIP